MEGFVPYDVRMERSRKEKEEYNEKRLMQIYEERILMKMKR